MQIIDKVQKKIKDILQTSWIDDVFWAAIIVFVALGSFSLGVHYQQQRFLDQHPLSVTVNKDALLLWNEYNQIKRKNTNYFGSKNGSTVYPSDCSAGNRILEENKVYFNSISDAQSFGYKPSTRC